MKIDPKDIRIGYEVIQFLEKEIPDVKYAFSNYDDYEWIAESIDVLIRLKYCKEK